MLGLSLASEILTWLNKIFELCGEAIKQECQCMFAGWWVLGGVMWLNGCNGLSVNNILGPSHHNQRSAMIITTDLRARSHQDTQTERWRSLGWISPGGCLCWLIVVTAVQSQLHFTSCSLIGQRGNKLILLCRDHLELLPFARINKRFCQSRIETWKLERIRIRWILTSNQFHSWVGFKQNT